MPQYNYTVINRSGKRQRSTVEASSEDAAIEILQSKGMYIIDIVEEGLSFSSSKKCKTKLSDISVFARQVSTMMASGVSIITTFEALEDQNDDKRFRAALRDIKSKVQKGISVSEAMRDNSAVFPPLLCTMIEAGEMTGDLDKAFDRMAAYYDKENKMRQKIVNATIYPSILAGVSALAITALMIFAIPQFLGVFQEMQIPLPGITKFVLGLAGGMKTYWYLIVLAVALISSGYKMYYKSPNGGVAIDKVKLRIPVIGDILAFAALARFSRTLSALIEAGVSMISALEITKNVVVNKYMMKNMDGMLDGIKSGEPLSENLGGINIIPKIFTVMVRTGEDSGRLDYMLLKAAEMYENEVDVKVGRINTIIEPVIIVFLAIVLGGIMASVMLPMFTLYGNM
ncbi:type II secretion system F family protein [Clostridium cylindrosporum]|uniref:Type IV pilus assembly protein TapC n=1 Tax=Clostridium cylindrosporum DSM 605 TaxID=1121307 RepID=A0A0J8DAF1_CLOCY|nr:type II secretion system F family protein [Clostridium cylindrosporum]KMT21283.1 type IV pilus assembly protein TapC [Clostridium cylindrosporum DSM 605]